LILCSLEDRASGWGLLTTAILKFPEPPSVPTKDANAAAGKDGSAQKEGIPPRGPKDRQAPKPRRPQPLIKLVMRRWVVISYQGQASPLSVIITLKRYCHHYAGLLYWTHDLCKK